MSIARYMPANDDRGCGTVVRNDESGTVVFYDDYAAEVARLNEQVQELKGRLQLIAELNDARAALHAEAEKHVYVLVEENANMRSAIDQTIGWQESVDPENVESVRLLVVLKTPATDAILNEVRAQVADDLVADLSDSEMN